MRAGINYTDYVGLATIISPMSRLMSALQMISDDDDDDDEEITAIVIILHLMILYYIIV